MTEQPEKYEKPMNDILREFRSLLEQWKTGDSQPDLVNRLLATHLKILLTGWVEYDDETAKTISNVWLFRSRYTSDLKEILAILEESPNAQLKS